MKLRREAAAAASGQRVCVFSLTCCIVTSELKPDTHREPSTDLITIADKKKYL